MPLCRSLLALSFFAAITHAAELRTLKGDAHKGELVSVSDMEVVFAKGAERITVPTSQVLNIELTPPEVIPRENAYVDVELTDGTVLHCSQCRIKGKTVTATVLLTGQKLELPMGIVSNVLTSAQNEKYRKDWTDRLKKKGKTDVLATLNQGTVNPLPGLIGEGNADGTKLTFTAKLGTKEETVEVPAENIHGLIFKRDFDPNAKPPVCRLSDTYRDLIMVESLAQAPEGLTVKTPAGVKLLFPMAKLALLDYSNGKLVFLSDLNPDRLDERSTEDRIDHFKRDRNMDGRDVIKIKSVPYPKGLSIHADARLDFDVNGEFEVFKFVPGFDDVVGGVAGPVKLRIEGDGKELYARTFDRKEWKASAEGKELALNIKDVQTLRIEVISGDLLTLGKHLVIANARISK
jgi:hypothetical protein